MARKNDAPPERTFLDVWGQLDKERIANVIVPATGSMTDFDFDDAKACVYAAAERWLMEDLGNFAVTGLECREAFWANCGLFKQEVKAFVDMKATVVQKPQHNVFKPYTGQTVIVDWKSARAALDTRWSDRLINSQQWRLYAAATGAKLFVYRGVRRRQQPGEDPETRAVILEVPDNNLVETDLHAAGVIRMRRALVDSKMPIWPRNMPSACHEFQRACPYLADCEGGTSPLAAGADKVLSYSSMKDFLTCPERHRRNTMPGSTSGDNNDTLFGNAVHRGLAEVWSQAFNIPVEERETRKENEPIESE